MYTHRYYNSTKEGVEYIKMQFGKNLITKNIYENFSDEQIKKEYCKLNKNKENIEKIISLIITSIKKIYDYSITFDDLNYLNKFINNISLDITNTEAFYAFLIFSVIKNINNEQIHVLFLNDLLAQKTYTQSNKLYEFLEIKANLNIIPDDSSLTKKDIFKSNIIFSDWKQIVWEHLNTINIEKIANRPIIKYDCAFIFYIDIIIYD